MIGSQNNQEVSVINTSNDTGLIQRQNLSIKPGKELNLQFIEKQNKKFQNSNVRLSQKLQGGVYTIQDERDQLIKQRPLSNLMEYAQNSVPFEQSAQQFAKRNNQFYEGTIRKITTGQKWNQQFPAQELQVENKLFDPNSFDQQEKYFNLGTANKKNVQKILNKNSYSLGFDKDKSLLQSINPQNVVKKFLSKKYKQLNNQNWQIDHSEWQKQLRLPLHDLDQFLVQENKFQTTNLEDKKQQYIQNLKPTSFTYLDNVPAAKPDKPKVSPQINHSSSPVQKYIPETSQLKFVLYPLNIGQQIQSEKRQNKKQIISQDEQVLQRPVEDFTQRQKLRIPFTQKSQVVEVVSPELPTKKEYQKQLSHYETQPKITASQVFENQKMMYGGSQIWQNHGSAVAECFQTNDNSPNQQITLDVLGESEINKDSNFQTTYNKNFNSNQSLDSQRRFNSKNRISRLALEEYLLKKYIDNKELEERRKSQTQQENVPKKEDKVPIYLSAKHRKLATLFTKPVQKKLDSNNNMGFDEIVSIINDGKSQLSKSFYYHITNKSKEQIESRNGERIQIYDSKRQNTIDDVQMSNRGGQKLTKDSIKELQQQNKITGGISVKSFKQLNSLRTCSQAFSRQKKKKDETLFLNEAVPEEEEIQEEMKIKQSEELPKDQASTQAESQVSNANSILNKFNDRVADFERKSIPSQRGQKINMHQTHYQNENKRVQQLKDDAKTMNDQKFAKLKRHEFLNSSIMSIQNLKNTIKNEKAELINLQSKLTTSSIDENQIDQYLNQVVLSNKKQNEEKKKYGTFYGQHKPNELTLQGLLSSKYLQTFQKNADQAQRDHDSYLKTLRDEQNSYRQRQYSSQMNTYQQFF